MAQRNYDEIVADENELEAFYDEARTVSEKVAALIPGATSQDDGAGEFVNLTPDADDSDMLHICYPDNSEPEQRGRWMFVGASGRTTALSDLTIDSAPAEVAAWYETVKGA